MPQITPFIWFDHQADEAMRLYTSIFDDSRIESVERYPDESLDPHFANMNGKVISGSFTLRGHRFACLDGGPMFTPNPSISFFSSYSDRASLVEPWQALAEDGKILMDLGEYPWSPAYGWLQDRFGVSWQFNVATGEAPAQPITPMLMFTGAVAGRAGEAMQLYTQLFDDSAIDGIDSRNGEPGTPGSVMRARFHLGAHHFLAMDSPTGHDFAFNEGISLFVSCRDQAEIDRYWQTLTERGSESQCGWCIDEFGIRWQIVPENLGALLAAGPGAIQAMMGMTKFDIAALEQAGRESA